MATPMARDQLTLIQRPMPCTDTAEPTPDTVTDTALATTARGPPTLTPTTTPSTVPGWAPSVWSTPLGSVTATTTRVRRSLVKQHHHSPRHLLPLHSPNQ